MEKQTYKTIDDYIALFPKDKQLLLQTVRQIIHETAPEAIEAIKYAMPTFQLNNVNMIHFAALKNHIGIYPTPGPIEAFKVELEEYISTKGAIQFPYDKPIPLDLIKKIVEYRVKTINNQNSV